MQTMALLSSFLLLLAILLSYQPPPASAEERLTSFSASDSPWNPSQNRILLSSNSTFAAGFRRSPRSPSLFVFAVWVLPAVDQTIVWFLDSDVDLNATLTVSPLGVLTLNNDSSGSNLWPPGAAASGAGGSNDTKLLVLNSDGSLVFAGWSSFLSPTDTILPNQPVPANGTSLQAGNYRFVDGKILVYGKNDSYWSSGGAIQKLNSGGLLLVTNGNSMVSADVGRSALRRLTLDQDGNLRVYSLNKSGRWAMVWQAVQELCTIHGTCGHNAICFPAGSSATTCVCPPGYVNSTDGSGCLREATNSSNFSSKFLRLDYVSFDQGFRTANLTPLPFETCRSRCLAGVNCVGFSYKFDGTLYCGHHADWLAHGYWSPATEIAAFLRVASSETKVSNFTGMTSMVEAVCPVNISLPSLPNEATNTTRNLAIMITCFVLELLAGVLSFWAFLKKYSTHRDIARTFALEFLPAGGLKNFTYAELKDATNDFSDVVGSGGFGVVYKGKLPDHRVIAVKRLKNVSRREAEFRAELTIIARMHHLNLVRMWGFCVEKEQRMLVYEYVPNGSLDRFLFSKEDNGVKVPPERPLDWSIRYRIALGVARAIAYLHEECLEWVLHCDIKPENILLEDDFCPKVSDFGLAKLTDKEDRDKEANVSVSHIRGTRGYMAPEWMIWSEPITAKADVYSFGMVLLEIVTGMRNFEFQRLSLDSVDWYFPAWAFDKVYVELQVEEMIDRKIMESYDNKVHAVVVERMVKTALWCLQDRAEMRPSMGKVAKMLEGTIEITEPEKPTIFYLR